MTTFNGSGYKNTRNQDVPVRTHGDANVVKEFRSVVALTAAAVTTDTINFGYMPPGARLVGGYLKSDDLDTGGPTITINVGDAGSATRLFNASTVAQAGTTAQLTSTAYDYQYTTKTLITGALAANATTPAAGNLTLVLLYVVEDSATT